MNMKLELIPVPVTDIDRAKEFYVHKVGFHADHDHAVSDTLRFVQLTPAGSACSIVLDKGMSDMAPGTLRNLQMVIDSAQDAHDELQKRGVEVSDISEMPWGKFVYFSDPDGNTWALQELPVRN